MKRISQGIVSAIVIALMVAALRMPLPVLAAPTTLAGGDVAGTWTATDSPYLVEGDLTVPAGQTLSIEPGVEILFQAGTRLTVNGTLLADGTEAAPILFTSTDASTTWSGLRIVDASDSSRLTHVIVERGRAYGASPGDFGGGIYIVNTSPTISYSTIRDNHAYKAGGGIYLENSNAVLRHNRIINNQVSAGGSAFGGGIYMANSNPELTGNIIRNNRVAVSGTYSTPSGLGGGIYARSSSPDLRYNLIIDNAAEGQSNSYARGGAIYFQYGDPVLVNNTIANNSVGEGGGVYSIKEGGGLYLYWSRPTLVNTILWNNLGEEIYITGQGELKVGYTDVDGGASDVVNSEGAPITMLGGNINADPLFVDAAGGDYALQAGSPAVDAGIAYLAHNGIVYVDLASGQYEGSAPDMGGLEFGASGVPQNEAPTAVATASPDYGSAPLDVQFSSAGSSDPDGTLVAFAWDFGDGATSTEANPTHTYTAVGSYSAALTVTDDDGASHTTIVGVTVVDGTTIPGGEISGSWSAAGSPYRIAGDITIPAGQTLTIDPGVTVLFESWYRLTVNGTLLAEGTDAAPILFTAAEPTPGWLGIRFVNAPNGSRLTHAIVERGRATGADPLNKGGGIYIEGSNPLIANSIIRDNFAISSGGGLYITNATPILRDNLILNNDAGQGGTSYGGGLALVEASPELTGNEIRGNRVHIAGTYSTPSGLGGGIYGQRSDAVLRGNLIIDNAVDASTNSYARGGGLYFGNGGPQLINNTIVGNAVGESTSPYAIREGGGLYLSGSSPVLVNTILRGSTPQEIYVAGTGELTIAYSDIQGGQASIVNSEGATIAWLDGNLDADPLFVDLAGGDLNLQAGSPAVDAGTAFFTHNGSVLIDLAPEQYNGNAPDMGALESPHTGSINQPPVAVASATPTSGAAPLTVQFSAAGSDDPDGTLVSYVWDFGDGSGATEANPSHTYAAAGTYQAVLTVTDDAGASDSASVAITVEAVSQPAVHVASQTIVRQERGNRARAYDTVFVVDQTGTPVQGAEITVAWTGPSTGQAGGKTGTDGTTTVRTDWERRPQGGWCFEVTDVVLEGFVYDAAANVVTTQCETP